MKCLILAAGKGKRLMPLTKDKPKCLIEIMGKPILQYQLEALQKNNITDITIVTGYEYKKVESFLSYNRFNNLNITLIHNKSYRRSNSSYSFWLARDKVKDEPYIHLNCDVLFSPKLLKRLIDHPQQDVIVTDRKIKLKDNMEQVFLDKQTNKIIMMDNRPFKSAQVKACGIAKLSPYTTANIIKLLYTHIKSGDFNQNFYGIIRKVISFTTIYAMDKDKLLLKEFNTIPELGKIQATQ